MDMAETGVPFVHGGPSFEFDTTEEETPVTPPVVEDPGVAEQVKPDEIADVNELTVAELDALPPLETTDVISTEEVVKEGTKLLAGTYKTVAELAQGIVKNASGVFLDAREPADPKAVMAEVLPADSENEEAMVADATMLFQELTKVALSEVTRNPLDDVANNTMSSFETANLEATIESNRFQQLKAVESLNTMYDQMATMGLYEWDEAMQDLQLPDIPDEEGTSPEVINTLQILKDKVDASKNAVKTTPIELRRAEKQVERDASVIEEVNRVRRLPPVPKVNTKGLTDDQANKKKSAFYTTASNKAVATQKIFDRKILTPEQKIKEDAKVVYDPAKYNTKEKRIAFQKSIGMSNNAADGSFGPGSRRALYEHNNGKIKYDDPITDVTEHAAFLAQVNHESNGNPLAKESGYFKSVAQVSGLGISRGRFQGKSIASLLKNTVLFQNTIYGGKYGEDVLGNDKPGDGHKYRGRGLIQLTGKGNYKTYGDLLGVDFVANPDLAATKKWAPKIALAFWNTQVKGKPTTYGDVPAVSKVINGGTIGLLDRKRRFAKQMDKAIKVQSEWMTEFDNIKTAKERVIDNK